MFDIGRAGETKGDGFMYVEAVGKHRFGRGLDGTDLSGDVHAALVPDPSCPVFEEYSP